MEEKENKKTLAYRLGEFLGTTIVGSIIVLVIAITAKILMMLF